MRFLPFLASLALAPTGLWAQTAPAATATELAAQPTPPSDGARGTVSYWQKELQGKSKKDVKGFLGTPNKIADKGAIYFYPQLFFHPDLDEWRALMIKFDADDMVASFSGEGSDTRTYELAPQTWEDAADAAAIPAPSPEASPSPAPDLESLKEKIQACVTTIEMTEPARGADNFGAGGTGFVVEFEGENYVATNLHVLEGEASTEIQLAWHHGPRPGTVNSPRVPSQARVKSSFELFQKAVARLPLPSVKSVSGQRFSTGTSLRISQNRDICLIPIEADSPKLRFAGKPPKRGNTVLIVGNPEAGHTLAALEAEVSNVGPDRFELDRIRGGEIVPGMSGSPVVDAHTMEVVGIVTYYVERTKWVNDEVLPSVWGAQVIPSFQVQKRYFAYRCDNLADLERASWGQFVNDCLILTAIRERTLNVYWARNAYNAASDSSVVLQLPPDFDNKVQLAYSSFLKDAARFIKANDADYRIRRWNEYQRKLETLLQIDLVDPRYPVVTSYMRRQLETSAAAARREVAHALREEAGKVQ